MKLLLDKIKDPLTYAGFGTAISGFNWSTVAPVGSPHWWTSLLVVAGGIVAAVVRGPSHNGQ